MHWANFSIAVHDLLHLGLGRAADRRSGAGSGSAFWAAWNWELLTPSCCGVTFGNAPLLLGSGKFGTPWERMQRE